MVEIALKIIIKEMEGQNLEVHASAKYKGCGREI